MISSRTCSVSMSSLAYAGSFNQLCVSMQQAGPIQGSSQVLASLVSPGPHPNSTAPPAQAQPLVHPKYGEVKRPNYGQPTRPRAYHNYQSANQYNRSDAPFGASVNNWIQTVKPSNSLRPPIGNVSTPHNRGHQVWLTLCLPERIRHLLSDFGNTLHTNFIDLQL